MRGTKEAQGSRHLNKFQFPFFKPKLYTDGWVTRHRRGLGNASLLFAPGSYSSPNFPKAFQEKKNISKITKGMDSICHLSSNPFFAFKNFEFDKKNFNVSYVPFGIQDASK